MNKLLHITKIAVPIPHHLDITFSDGDRRVVDVRPLLTGPVFRPLINSPEAFAEVTLDPICKTVTWPCGVDLAPEALRSLAPVLL
jgi:Protein of unknown function (DUF2442)